MFPLSDDVFKIITDYTYCLKITRKELLKDIDRCIAIRESVDDEFLCICSYNKHLKTHISNPYRSFGPYHYTKTIDRTSIFGNAMICLCHCLSKRFFERIKSYRLVFIRYARAFQLGEFMFYNKLLTKYLIYISPQDILHLRGVHREQLMSSLDFCCPIPPHFL